LNTGLDKGKQGSGAPGPVTALLDSVTFKTSGADVQLGAHATEADAAALINVLGALAQ
jgi:hypothetical protein